MACIEHDRLAVRERFVEQLGVACVPALRHARRLSRDPFFFRIVINVEVLGPKGAELETPVGNLVAAEVLRVGRQREEEQSRREKAHEYRRAPNHGAPLSWIWERLLYHGGIGDRESGVAVASASGDVETRYASATVRAAQPDADVDVGQGSACDSARCVTRINKGRETSLEWSGIPPALNFSGLVGE